MTANTPDRSPPATAGGLRFLWLEITGRCNLSCSHCYAESGPGGSAYGHMSREDWTRVIADAAGLGCRDVQFIGGEPTMHPALPSLIAEARRVGFTGVEVYTNATRLGGDLVRCFREYGVAVASSFYSDDPSTHGRITGSVPSWERTVGGFRTVMAAGLPLRVGVIEMAENAGQADRTTRFLGSLGIAQVKVDRLRGVGRGGLHRLGRPGGEFDELCGQCWKGRLCVTPSGAAYPCVFARDVPVGDVRTGLAAVVGSAALATFRERLRAARRVRPAHACNPYPCNPDDQCRPDCTPNVDCPPTFCTPDGAGCTPNDPADCGPDR